ncbi:hypothetical protein IAU60_003013 [Kwoniella sp. DSM 27419]
MSDKPATSPRASVASSTSAKQDVKDQATSPAAAPGSNDKPATSSTSSPSLPDKAHEKAEAPPAETGEAEEDDEGQESTEDVIDMETFQQIMDMDEDDDADDEDGEKNSFSKGIVWGYFEQAEATFTEMNEAIVNKDLSKLSSLGHFLKGSSAALGIIKVQASCEKMQHYGNLRDEEAGVPLSSEEALKRIKDLLKACKKDYQVAKRWMENLYEEGK